MWLQTTSNGTVKNAKSLVVTPIACGKIRSMLTEGAYQMWLMQSTFHVAMKKEMLL